MARGQRKERRVMVKDTEEVDVGSTVTVMVSEASFCWKWCPDFYSIRIIYHLHIYRCYVKKGYKDKINIQTLTDCHESVTRTGLDPADCKYR